MTNPKIIVEMEPDQFSQHFAALYQRMETELAAIKEEAGDFRLEMERGVFIVRRYLQEMKQQVIKDGFASPQLEILFFRSVKPRFYSRLIYFLKVLNLIYRKPEGSRKSVLRYLRQQQSKIVYFFEKYSYLYGYCRSGDTSLDDQLFLRGKTRLLPGITFYGIDTDPSFTTGYDFIVAKMQSNELLQGYLEQEINRVRDHPAMPDLLTAGKKMSWTASKAALIELIYGLQSVGVLNHGTAALGDIAVFFETVLGIKLGNYYRVFQEIRIRKKSRTQFLDDIKDRLIQKMDYTDENPHLQG